MLYIATSAARDAVSSLIEDFRHFESKLLCKIHINIFQPGVDLDYYSKQEPSFIFSNILGFKTLFWKFLNPRKLLMVYPTITLIWLPDSDMGFRNFDVVMFVRNMQLSNTYIIQPAPMVQETGCTRMIWRVHRVIYV